MAKEGGAPITINWSDSEKVSLLLEVIKHKNVIPDWKTIKVPQGRTLASAQAEYLKLTSAFPIRPPAHKADEDEEMEDVSDSVTSARAAKKQRRGSSSDEASSNSGADGAASSNASENGAIPGKRMAPPATPATVTVAGQFNPLLPIKRKRGRPTKAESEARKAAQARGEALPPKPPSYTPVSTPVYTVGPDGVQRRRRGRPSKAEVAARKAAEAAAAGAVPVTSATAPASVAAATTPAASPIVKSEAS